MNKLTILLLIMMVVIVAACASNVMKNRGFKTVTGAEFSKMISANSSIQLIDVRTPEEFAEGHIAGARLINVWDSTFVEQAKSQLSKDKPVAVYCRSGKRSATAAGKLVKLGYEVINLDGGITAWKEENHPVEK